MNHLPNISRTSSLLLAVALGACTPENPATSETESSSGTGSSTEGDPTSDPSGDPSSTPTTTTDETTTTEPTTGTTGPTDPTTGTTEPGTESATDGTTDGTSSTGEPVAELTAVWSTANPAGINADALVGLAPELDAVTATQTLLGDVISIQSLAYLNNDAIVTYDAPGGTGGVLIVDNLPNNLVAAPIGLGTRLITGPTTGLVSPRGLEADGPDGLILVADTGAGILAFKNGDKGDIAPQFAVTMLGEAESVWDIHYVEADDTLYAAGTNGQVLAYEEFSVAQGQGGPDRIITPTQNDSQVSVNLHGITVNGNKLYLSDVGDAMDNADGQLFVIDDVGNADGNVEVLQRIQGGDLGNPVDIELRSSMVASTLFVAEKANDKLLVFREDVITKELAPAAELAVIKPESVALRTGTTLLLSQNGAGIDGDGALLVNTPMIGNPTAGAVLSQIGSVSSIQSLALTADGRGYVGFDGPAVSGGGGVFVVDGLTSLAGEGQVDAVATRLWGPETGIVSPKGIILTAAQDRLIVADTAAANIKVFDLADLGNSEPLFVFDDLGGAPVWDVAYDDAEDRLFAAGTDGVVRVFDGALASQGNDAPTRLIIPTDGADKISVNLHGIHYDAASKILILSDVGDPMDPADGAIFLIADADTADDQVEVLAAIRGDATKLGNPVDIAFDGTDLFVAEKSNSAILRYDAILEFTGAANNEAEDATIEVTNPESVQVFISLP